MSRAPAHETPVSALNAAMSPFGVIDFVDNQCVQPAGIAGAAGPGLSPAGVVGGPPAYLDAHGIRYVPAAALEADAGQEQAAPAPRSAPHEAAPISQRDLNSRVDDRVRKFILSERMSDSPRDERLRALREDIESSRAVPMRGGVLRDDYDDYRQAPRRASSHRSPLDEDDDISGALRSLHKKIEDLENRQARGARRGPESDMEADAGKGLAAKEDQAGDRAARLKALRAECEAAAARSKQRVSAACDF